MIFLNKLFCNFRFGHSIGRLVVRSLMVGSAMLSVSTVHATIGADLPGTTIEAEAMRTNGSVLGPIYGPHRIESESSEQQAVELRGDGAFVEFTSSVTANALVLRYHLPDAPQGGGVESTLELLINGVRQAPLALSSRYTWLYGNYPFSNDPREGKPRNFYDEVRRTDLTLVVGDVIRIEKVETDGVPCTLDLVDLEWVAPPLGAPAESLSLLDFGARGDGETDATAALRLAVEAAHKQGWPIWVPPGTYLVTGDVVLPDGVTIQGAGMWHTTFVGDAAIYGDATRRVRFKLTGRGIRLADFAIVGRLNYRDDQEANDGIVGAGCADSTIERIWIEHTKVGVWIYNGVDLTITGCRFRNLLADGVNLCVGTAGCVVENCSARGTGDDCFAIWPAAFDQGFVGESPQPGHNVIRRCTGQLTFLANGGAIYGGADNRLEDCLFTDIGTGCGILISTTFPTADETRGIDNNFSGTTIVRNNRLVRCGGWDHSWTWRGSMQICMDRRSIAGLEISDMEIRDSISDGLTIVGPGSSRGQGSLSDSRLTDVTILNSGLGAPERPDVYIRADAVGGLEATASVLGRIDNQSDAFDLKTQDARVTLRGAEGG